MMRKTCLWICLNFIVLSTSAQVVEDFGLWNTYSFSTDLTDKIQAEIDQEFRFSQNVTMLERIFTDFGLSYKIVKELRIGGHYRYILDRRLNGIYGHRQRFSIDLSLKHKYRRFTFTNRFRMQWEDRGQNYEASSDRGFETNLRNTLKIGYRINRRYEPYINGDIRYVINDPGFPRYTGFDRYRLGIGVDMDLNENFLFGTYFLYSEPLLFPGVRQFVIGTKIAFGSGRNLFGT